MTIDLSTSDDRQALLHGVLGAIATTIDAEDRWSHAGHGHGARVAHLAWHLAEALHLPDSSTVLYAALLHDLGASALEEHVADFAVRECTDPTVQSHPMIGRYLLASCPVLAPIVPAVEAHHERVDGGGFPRGRRGDEIPPAASVIHLADALEVQLRAVTPGDPLAACLDRIRALRGRAVPESVADAAAALLGASPEVLEIALDGPRLAAACAGRRVTFPGVERGPRQTLITQLLALLARVIDARHHRRFGHSVRVAFYAFRIARQLGLELLNPWDVAWAGLVHDLGMAAVPRRLLGWEPVVSAADRVLYESHAALGGERVACLPGLSHLAPAVAAHHERWDGGGYPCRLAGERIPLIARVLAWAHRYAVLTAPPVMGAEMPHLEAMAALTAEVGTALDPHIAPSAIAALETHGPAHPDLSASPEAWRDLFELEPAAGISAPPAIPDERPRPVAKGALLLDLEPWRRVALTDDLQLRSGDGGLAEVAAVPASARLEDYLGEESRRAVVEIAASLGVDGAETRYLFTPAGRPLEAILQRAGDGLSLLVRSAENRLATMDRLAHFYRNFLASGEAVVFTDPEGRILDVNRAFLDLFGYSLREVIGQHTRMLSSGRQSRAFYRGLWSAIRDPAVGSWCGELIDRRSDGREVHVFLRISVVRAPTGECLGYIAHHSDISDRKRAEAELQRRDQELREKNAELQRLSQFKSDVVAITSHDLKSPLASIVGLATLLRRSLPRLAPDALAGHLDRIADTARGLTAFINDLLDLERLESGTLRLDLGRVRLGPLAEQCAEQVRVAAQGRIRVEADVADAPGAILADAARVEQILGNLLGNAAKFAPDGSTVSVSVRGDERRARLVVEDEGPGVPPDQLASIFERWVQGARKGAAPARGLGAGLGLSIVRSLVELHGGAVWAENRAPTGCRFVVELPARLGDPRLAQPVALLREAPSPRTYELIDLLHEVGVAVRRVDSLAQLRSLLEMTAPELVLVGRPFLDTETLAYLQHLPAGPRRIVLDDQEPSAGEPDVLDGVLVPPILEEELRALLPRREVP